MLLQRLSSIYWLFHTTTFEQVFSKIHESKFLEIDARIRLLNAHRSYDCREPESLFDCLDNIQRRVGLIIPRDDSLWDWATAPRMEIIIRRSHLLEDALIGHKKRFNPKKMLKVCFDSCGGYHNGLRFENYGCATQLLPNII